MSTAVDAGSSNGSGSAWPVDGESRVALLRFARTQVERKVLEDWLGRERPEGAEVSVLEAGDGGIGGALSNGSGDPWVAPVRVAWLPRERGGKRAARLTDLVRLRNPRRPKAREQARILRSQPDRCRVVVAEPARVSELRARLERDGGDVRRLGEFILRQAVLALGRAERNLFGTQYKVPRFVSQEISSSVHFREAAAQLAGELGQPEGEVGAEASGYIDEMVASQDELAIDAWGQFGRFLARAYDIELGGMPLEELQELNSRAALVFLPSHRSYLDPLVLRAALAQGGFPPSHVLGGINMAFWPIGPVARRSGYVFIRRSFRDNPVYKLALRQYMAFLLRKRFNLEWYIEGGRGRTGKLRPPRFGLLSYLVEAFDEGGVDDVRIVPVSIVYDQLHEVGAMAAEERGAKKTPEGFGWFVGYARAQGRRLGTVRVNIGEPMSLGDELDRSEHSLEKVAFEVSHRINRAAPMTPTAVVTLALLGVEDRALTLAQVRETLDPLLDYVEKRGLPQPEGVDLRTDDGVRATLDVLQRGGIVSVFEDGVEPVWSVGADRHLEAAFYRNSIVHFFVNRAITELVIVRALEEDGGDVIERAWEEALRLRDLLKFEFFFPRKRDFDLEIRAEMELVDPDWERRAADPDDALELLADALPHLAHRVLRPFLEAYQVVADRLAAQDPGAEVDEKEFLGECIGAARQYELQGRIYSPESISREIFAGALKLAENRGLLEPGGDEVAARRHEFAKELRAEVRRVEAVRDLALNELGAE